MSGKDKLTDIVYKILLDGPGPSTTESYDMLLSLSRSQKHKLYDEVHEIIDVAGVARRISIVNILAASLKVEEIIMTMNARRGITNDSDEDVEKAWVLIWNELINQKRIREIPSVVRSRFMVVK